jgi:hypothetical protein
MVNKIKIKKDYHFKKFLRSNSPLVSIYKIIQKNQDKITYYTHNGDTFYEINNEIIYKKSFKTYKWPTVEIIHKGVRIYNSLPFINSYLKYITNSLDHIKVKKQKELIDPFSIFNKSPYQKYKYLNKKLEDFSYRTTNSFINKKDSYSKRNNKISYFIDQIKRDFSEYQYINKIMKEVIRHKTVPVEIKILIMENNLNILKLLNSKIVHLSTLSYKN